MLLVLSLPAPARAIRTDGMPQAQVSRGVFVAEVEG